MKTQWIVAALCGLSLMACQEKKTAEAVSSAAAVAAPTGVVAEAINPKGDKLCFEYKGKNQEAYKSYLGKMAQEEKSQLNFVNSCSMDQIAAICDQAEMYDVKKEKDSTKFDRGSIFVYLPIKMDAKIKPEELKSFMASMCSDMLKGKLRS